MKNQKKSFDLTHDILGILNFPLLKAFLIVFLAIIIGIIGGFGAIVFKYLIIFFQDFFTNIQAKSSGGTYLKIFIPAIGILIVGFITNYFAKETKGDGVPQILLALSLKGGRIKPKVAFFGILTPAITIGSGGSVGQEGPIALIGAAFGSTVGQILKLPEKYLTLFLACGSAAGIAAIFNAPFAGAFFGLEVILGSYAMSSIVPVFISAVTGTLVFTNFMGIEPVLKTSTYFVSSFGEIFFIIILGAIAGIGGLTFTKGLSFSEEVFDKWKVPFWVKAIFGGTVVGLIGLYFPQILGVGYTTIIDAINGSFSFKILLLLLIFKYIATLITISAGGSGGTFAPSLYLGVMLGGMYGIIVGKLFPNFITEPLMYCLIGMGAIFAASAQAPLTASTMILEVTGDYLIAPGVMAACAISYLIHGLFNRNSMYTEKLAKRGIKVLRGTDIEKKYNKYDTKSLEKIERLLATRKGVFEQFVISETSEVVGKKVCELDFPKECVIVSIMRDKEIIVPHGDTVLKKDDKLLIFSVSAKKLTTIQKYFECLPV